MHADVLVGRESGRIQYKGAACGHVKCICHARAARAGTSAASAQQHCPWLLLRLRCHAPRSEAFAPACGRTRSSTSAAARASPLCCWGRRHQSSHPRRCLQSRSRPAAPPPPHLGPTHCLPVCCLRLRCWWGECCPGPHCLARWCLLQCLLQRRWVRGPSAGRGAVEGGGGVVIVRVGAASAAAGASWLRG
jgi:hypothetical protein